ncbi:MAG: hypothetical protein ACRDTH_07220 [Pseudonocardiaceae bacterium]
MNRRERRWHGYVLGIGALAWAVLMDLARGSFTDHLDVSGVVGLIVLTVIVVLAVYWMISNLPSWVREFRRGLGGWWAQQGGSPPPAAPTALRSYAEQAERFLYAVGSKDGGMAAAEWFTREETALRRLLAESEAGPETADDLASICDALEVGYVRQRRAVDLLELSHQLSVIGERSGRRDLRELAEVRAATAHRLMGNLDKTTDRLGVASSLAPRGKTAAAMRARRAMERGLAHLARANCQAPGADRIEEIMCARDRFDDAGLAVPRADVAADIANHLNIGITYLYQYEADQDGQFPDRESHSLNKAYHHLRLAAARASDSRDASAQSQALELIGVAAWLQDNRSQAIRYWHEARHGYADVGEGEGEARCLQHLGSAEWICGNAAEARALLRRSERLRGGVQGHEVLKKYANRIVSEGSDQR